MGKTYTFLDIAYDNLNELGIAYSQHFNEALDDVFDNTKKLIKFIRSQDKILAKDIASTIITCKYQNNVVTFIIFSLCKDKRVIINGRFYSFKDFISAIKKYGPEHRAIYAFIEDLGISRTFANLNMDVNLSKDSYFIEKSINSQFTQDYLTTYFEFDYVESLSSFISNVFIYTEEKFRRSLKIINNERFQMILAHKVGFKEVYYMRNEAMPLFRAVKLLACEFETADLSKLIDDTFYWWLLSNYDKYTYKKEAKAIKKQFNDLKKEKSDLDKNYNFNTFVDLSKKLYDLYLDFVDYMKQNKIVVNKEYDSSEYILDKAYCRTYICTNFMKSHTVKLPKENLIYNDDQKELDINDEQVIDDNDDDFVPVIEQSSNDISINTLNKQKNLTKRMNRFIIWEFVFIIMFSIAVGVISLLDVVLIDEMLSLPQNIISMVSLIFFIIAGLCGIGLFVYMKMTINTSMLAIDNLIIYDKLCKVDESLTPEEDIKLRRIENKLEYFRGKVFNSFKITSTIFSVAGSYLICVGIIYLLTFINAKITLPFGWESAYLTSDLKFLYFIVAPIIAAIYGLLRKRKGAFTAILLAIIAIASVILFAVIL